MKIAMNCHLFWPISCALIKMRLRVEAIMAFNTKLTLRSTDILRRMNGKRWAMQLEIEPTDTG